MRSSHFLFPVIIFDKMVPLRNSLPQLVDWSVYFGNRFVMYMFSENPCTELWKV